VLTKAREYADEYLNTFNGPPLYEVIARALAAEHDAALERAATQVASREFGTHFAEVIRAMKGASDE
jgi:hypothetical protein